MVTYLHSPRTRQPTPSAHKMQALPREPAANVEVGTVTRTGVRVQRIWAAATPGSTTLTIAFQVCRSCASHGRIEEIT
ncbi:hypothetical protein ACFVTE_19375 [Arthrobacter sp. NPDC058097]|uniref:hypothetical protein n=1 Tax=Arthrobacter sp. NPDC058097 TaxID=3346340 RepID=UPI0036DA3198